MPYDLKIKQRGAKKASTLIADGQPRALAREAARVARENPGATVFVASGDHAVMDCNYSIYPRGGQARRRNTRAFARCSVSPAFKKLLRSPKRRKR